MTAVTRRRALLGAVGLISALAGCSETIVGTEEESVTQPVPAGRETSDNVETDPVAYTLRNPRDELAAWIRKEDDAADAGKHEEAGRTDRRYLPNHGLVASAETADRLTFADVEGADEARAFVDETDFETETLLLDTDRIGECYRLRLCSISWSETGFHTSYARVYRDVDVACSTDAHDGIATLIRIPDTLDPEQVSGFGSSTGTGGCHHLPRGRVAAEGHGSSADGDESGEEGTVADGNESEAGDASADADSGGRK